MTHNITQFTLFGPVNTGTNLIEKIMGALGLTNKRVHNKHQIHMNEIVSAMEKSNDDKTIYIFAYKPIYNWIASVQKEPYLLRFMNRNHTYVRSNINPRVQQQGDFNVLQGPISCFSKEYSNIIQVYNEYYMNYLSILQKHYPKFIIIDYYKLINGIDGFNYLKRKILEKYPLFKINLSENAYIDILNKPSKNHGKSVQSYKEAMEKKEKNRVYYQREISIRPSLKMHLNESLYRQIEHIAA